MKTILLLGKHEAIMSYASSLWETDIEKEIEFLPSPFSHHSEFEEYIEKIKEEAPPIIVTQNEEFLDALLNSDMDFDIVTVRKYEEEVKERTLSKEKVKEMREKFDFDPRD